MLKLLTRKSGGQRPVPRRESTFPDGLRITLHDSSIVITIFPKRVSGCVVRNAAWASSNGKTRSIKGQSVNADDFTVLADESRIRARKSIQVS